MQEGSRLPPLPGVVAMDALCSALLVFLTEAGLTAAPAPPCPALSVVAPATLAVRACEGPCPGLLAWYEAGARRIYLVAGFDADDPLQASVLLHELVHYLQDLRGGFSDGSCRAGLLREVEAFRWQERWLARAGAWQPVGMALMNYGCATPAAG